MTPDEQTAVGHWVHAHEEDDDLHRVFRRVGGPLPPSRGRTELVVAPDLTVATSGPGGDDRRRAGVGARLVFGKVDASASSAERVLRVSDVRADRLRLLKE